MVETKSARTKRGLGPMVRDSVFYAFFGLAYFASLGLLALLSSGGADVDDDGHTPFIVASISIVCAFLFFAITPWLFPSWAPRHWFWLSLSTAGCLFIGGLIAGVIRYARQP